MQFQCFWLLILGKSLLQMPAKCLWGPSLLSGPSSPLTSHVVSQPPPLPPSNLFLTARVLPLKCRSAIQHNLHSSDKDQMLHHGPPHPLLSHLLFWSYSHLTTYCSRLTQDLCPCCSSTGNSLPSLHLVNSCACFRSCLSSHLLQTAFPDCHALPKLGASPIELPSSALKHRSLLEHVCSPQNICRFKSTGRFH